MAGVHVFVSFMALLLLFSIISNAMVVVSVLKFRRLRKVTNMLISNLAVSDILLAGLYMPQKLHDLYHTDNYHEGEFLCRFVNFVPVFLITSSCYTLVCISFERLRAIMYSNRRQLTVTHTKRIIPVIWFFSLALAVPSYLEYSTHEVSTSSDTNITETSLLCSNTNMPRSFILINGSCVLIVSFLIPLVLVFCNYIRLASFIHRRGRQVSTERPKGTAVTTVAGKMTAGPATAQPHLQKNRMRLVKMMVLVASMYAICWIPFFVLYIYMKVTGKDASKDVGSAVGLLLIAMGTFSTSYNVILYVIFNRNFRDAFRNIIKCSWNQLPENQSMLQS